MKPTFRQELNLADGFIEIESEKNDGQNKLMLKLNCGLMFSTLLFMLMLKPMRQLMFLSHTKAGGHEDKELAFGKERFGAFGLEGYPGKVIRTKDNIEQTGNGILFYHRNPKEKLVPEIYIKYRNWRSMPMKLMTT